MENIEASFIFLVRLFVAIFDNIEYAFARREKYSSKLDFFSLAVFIFAYKYSVIIVKCSL